jgi:rubrerythrin
MRRQNQATMSDLEKTGDGFAIAAENIQLIAEPEEQDVRWPRASSLYDACMRMHAIGTKQMKTRKQWISVQQRVTYGIGNALHYWIQNTPDVLGAKRRGWWKCLACGKIAGFGAPPRKKCPSCKARKEALEYHEHYLRVQGPLWFVTGHVDMFLEKEKVFRVLEVKTIDGDRFEDLVAPLAEHEWQLQTYMWGLNLPGCGPPVPVDADVGYVLYLSKKHPGAKKLPVKMYPVKRSPGLIDRIEAKLTLYTEGLRDYPKNLPDPIEECQNGGFTGYRAKTCPCLAECQRSA